MPRGVWTPPAKRAYARWAAQLYWPTTLGPPPRRADGSVDVPALCRRWDDAVNAGAGPARAR